MLIFNGKIQKILSQKSTPSGKADIPPNLPTYNFNFMILAYVIAASCPYACVCDLETKRSVEASEASVTLILTNHFRLLQVFVWKFQNEICCSKQKQESWSIAKLTARCALYMGALKNFESPWAEYAHGDFSQNC